MVVESQTEGSGCRTASSSSLMKCLRSSRQRSRISPRFSLRGTCSCFSRLGSLATSIFTTIPNVSQSWRYICKCTRVTLNLITTTTSWMHVDLGLSVNRQRSNPLRKALNWGAGKLFPSCSTWCVGVNIPVPLSPSWSFWC